MPQPFGGPWMDPAGNPLANGYLIVYLVQDAASSGTQICAGKHIKIILDSGGNFPISVTLTPTTGMNPPTKYIVSAYTAQGEPSWGPMSLTLS